MLEGVVKKLTPTAQPSRAPGDRRGVVNGQPALFDRKVATLRTLITEHPEVFVDGITANALAEYWTRENLQPGVSLQVLRRCFEQLRDEGVMRADRVVKGGGMAWKLVNQENGGSDGA
jgi:hypothetical protein